MFSSSERPPIPDLAEIMAQQEADNVKRRDFLRDKTPFQVLMWLMRSADCPADIRAQCAMALLPYCPPEKSDIEPSPKPEG